MKYINKTNTNVHIMPHVIIPPGKIIELSSRELQNSMITVLIEKGWLELLNENSKNNKPVEVERNSSVDFIGHNPSVVVQQPKKAARVPDEEESLDEKELPLTKKSLNDLIKAEQAIICEKPSEKIEEKVIPKVESKEKPKRYKKLDSVLDEALSKAKEEEPVLAKTQKIPGHILEQAIREAEMAKKEQNQYDPRKSMAPDLDDNDEYILPTPKVKNNEYGSKEESDNFAGPMAVVDGRLHSLGELGHHVEDVPKEDKLK